MRTESQWKGPALVAGSAVLYGVCPALTKLTYAWGATGVLCTFYICLFALPMLYGWARRSAGGIRVSRGVLRRLALLSLGTCPTSLLLNCSYAYIPVGMSTALHYVYPVAVAVYLACFFAERFTPLRVGALALALGGIACLSLRSLGGSPAGIALAVGSGLAFAFYIVYLDRSGLKALPASVVGFYMTLANLVWAGAAALLCGQFLVFPSPAPWALLVLLAFVQRVGGNSLFQVGLRGTPAFSAGILSAFEPATSVLVGALALGERFAPVQVLGIALMGGGILCSALAARRTGR